MTLSAPVYLLKRQARLLSRREHIPLHQALDRIARREGFTTWSLLAARHVAEARPGKALMADLIPGDLVLLGARPGHGKTVLGLELAVEAMKAGRQGVFFSLECSKDDVAELFHTLGEDPAAFDDRFGFDDSDDLCAGYMIDRLGSAPRGTVVVVDYLQLLDQRREHPALMDQIVALKTFARERGLIMVFISQIHRRYDPAVRPCPDLSDVRLPNPLDLTMFDKACFLNDGEMRLAAVS